MTLFQNDRFAITKDDIAQSAFLPPLSDERRRSGRDNIADITCLVEASRRYVARF